MFMDIRGFNKTTLLDFPGHVAAGIFVGGCNFACPFCHNWGLVTKDNSIPSIPEEDVLAHINKRKNVLTGVCISGGEPTLYKDLPEFAAKIKDMGLLVKLDTNGYNPEAVSELIDNKLVDYVAMDIKASRDNYNKAVGKEVDITRIQETIDLITNSGIDYEFRTTCVKGIHSSGDFEDIADWIKGADRYFLQDYIEKEAVPDKSNASFFKEEMTLFLNIVMPNIPNAKIRGMD